MFPIFVSIFPVFLLIASGFFIRKKLINEGSTWDHVEKLVYYIFFPALLITKIAASDFERNISVPALVAVVAATLSIGGIAFISKSFFKIRDDTFTSVFQGGVRYNSYVFIAMSQSLFGSDGVAMAGVVVAYMVVITNVLSVLVMNFYGEKDEKDVSNISLKLLTNPLMIATLLGVLLNFSQISLAGPFSVYLNYLGEAAAPLSLLAVGAGLARAIKKNNLLPTVYATLLKTVVLPLITLFFLITFKTSGLSANVALLYATVPCAGNAFILARQMGGDAETMAAIITASTLFSMLSTTLIMGMVRF